MFGLRPSAGFARRCVVAAFVWLAATACLAGQASPAAAQPVVDTFFDTTVSVPVGSTVGLIINIGTSASALTSVAFTDSLPSGVVVATPNNLFSNCGGTVTAVAGSGTVSLSGGSMGPSPAGCTIGLNVLATSAGLKSNTVTVTSDQGTSAPDTDSMTVTAGATTTTVGSSVNPSTFGQSVTFTATVTGAGVAPTGTVTFKDGSTTLGTGTLAAGTATFATTSLTVGSHTITAEYGGDSNYTTSTSTGLTQAVNQATTTTTVGSSANPSTLGQSVTFTATVTGAGGTPTGTVTFKDGSTTLGTGTLAAGTATLATASLTVGSHTITAEYGGDSNYTASTSTGLTQAVNQATTTTTIGSSANPSTLGQSVTFTATVTGAGGTPTGTVTFKDGSTTLGTGTLAAGTATLATASLTVGSHTITAEYGGDSNYTTSTSTGLTQAVNQATTTTTIGSSANPSTLGQSVTFTATVTGAGGTPTGTVTFKDGSTTLGTGTLAAGTATFATAALTVGSHTITAEYGGDSNYTTSTSTGLTQAVNQAMTATTLGSSANPSTLGQSVTFTATVTGAGGTPTGTVTFKDGSTTLGTGTLAAGTATLATASLTVGSHTITAEYGGDGNYTASTSTGLTQAVNQATTTTTVGSSANPSTLSQSVTFTATVTGAGGTPTGTVTFKDGSTTLGTGTLAAGTATLATASLTVGSHTITAEYGGDSNYTTSTSTGLTQAVNQATTTTTVGSSANPSTLGQSVTFTATVTGAGGTPTGTVTFKDGSTTLGTGTLAAGTATLATASLTVGSHTITAEYGGDSNYTTSTSTGLTQTVNQASTTTTVGSSTNPSNFGQSVTFTSTVSSTAGTPTGTVTFKDGSTTLGTGTLSGGTATFATTALGAGDHAITAVYGSDPNFSTSTSSQLTQTVIANGTVIVRVTTTDGDGTFAFSSATPALSFSLATAGGSAQSSGISLNLGTYTVTATPPSGFGLTAVTCSDADSTGDVSTRSATIRLAPSETVTCTFASANSRAKTVETIQRFMSRRNDLIMSNQPDGNRQIDRLLEAQRGSVQGPAVGFRAPDDGAASRLGPGFDGSDLARFRFMRRGEPPLGLGRDADDLSARVPGVAVAPFRFMGSEDGPLQMTFSTSLRQMTRFADEVKAYRAQQDGVLGLGPTTVPARAARPNAFDFWIEGRFASFADDRKGAGLDGHFGLVYVGADYVINPSFLVGALVQFDSMRQTSQQLSSDIWGQGWMVGPYATIRLTDHLFLQGRAAWGRSSNEVSPYLTYTDEFRSDRWLVSSTLTGSWNFGPWQFRPSASVSFMEDVAKSYTDSLGVVIPDVKTRLGQVKAGPAISYAHRLSDGSVIEPRFGLDVIWNFAGDNTPSSIGGEPAGPEGVRGKVEVGVRAMSTNGLSLDLSGSYDGIGAGDFDALMGKATVRVPLN